MPAAPRVQPQDPSQSPTYNISTTQADHAIVPSIRRNLFSAHLSRRPVSNVISNIFGPPSPTLQHAPSRHDVFSSGPTLHPSKRMMDLKDIYDPRASPSHHTASPSTTSNLFPRDSIIAVDPRTGRPLLPNLPTLPPRIRLSDDDDGEDGSDEEMDHRDYLDYGRGYSHSPSHSRNFMPSSDFDFDPDIDLDSSDLNFIGIPRGNGASNNVISTFMDAVDNDESRRDRERIERLLGEMMNKQRAKARTLATSTSESSMGFPPSISTPMTSASGAVRATTRAGKARERKPEHPPPTRFDVSRTSTKEPALGGAGATMDPVEKDELMGLIMTSLRRKLQQAEDEGWMYGGAEGLGGIGIGADLGGDIGYE